MITVSIVTYKTETDELKRCIESLMSNYIKKIKCITSHHIYNIKIINVNIITYFMFCYI